MSRGPNLYSVFAVILPVSLGLGLIYLSATGRMEPMVALLVAVSIALLVPLAVVAAIASADDPQDGVHYYPAPQERR